MSGEPAVRRQSVASSDWDAESTSDSEKSTGASDAPSSALGFRWYSAISDRRLNWPMPAKHRGYRAHALEDTVGFVKKQWNDCKCPYEQVRKIQLLTDMDDTLYPNKTPGAGRDDRPGLDQKRLYPCVKEVHNRVYDLFRLPTVVISARPTVLLHEHEELQTRHGLPPLFMIGGDIAGSLAGASAAVVQTYWNKLMAKSTSPARKSAADIDAIYKDMAATKLETIKTYKHTLRREGLRNIDLVFIGDNGQGDLQTAKDALKAKYISMAFIHVVTRDAKTFPQSRSQPNLFYFCTYESVLKQISEHITEQLTPEQQKRDGHMVGLASTCGLNANCFRYADACKAQGPPSGSRILT